MRHFIAIITIFYGMKCQQNAFLLSKADNLSSFLQNRAFYLSENVTFPVLKNRHCKICLPFSLKFTHYMT
jgi:hypothetical protein